MKIKIGFFALLLLLSIWMTHSYAMFATLLAATLHELGHIIAAHFSHIDFQELKLGLFGAGFAIPSGKQISYPKEILISAAGPVVNLILVLPFLIYGKLPENEFYSAFLLSCLLLGCLNLLPIKDFDGGRIFRCLLCLVLSETKTYHILNITSFFCVFTLWICSVYLLMKFSSSLSLFIFSCQLFCKIIEKEHLTVL